MAKRIRRRNDTRTLLPPAEVITPAIARRWLHRTYPPLASLSAYGAYPQLVRGLGRRKENESAACGLRLIAADVRVITETCGRVLATGRPVEMRLYSNALGNHRGVARKLRAALRFEERHPHRGTRGIIRRALRERNRLAASQPRSWTWR